MQKAKFVFLDFFYEKTDHIIIEERFQIAKYIQFVELRKFIPKACSPVNGV